MPAAEDEDSQEDRDRLGFWKMRFDQAKDEHERTRTAFEYHLDNMSRWLEKRLTDYEIRAAAETRDHSRKTQGLLVVLIALVLIAIWRLW
jgi:hypothetical protein